ncbi:hypothetical protein MK489_20495 [Myxococcota bacterium]|nr:hypothetical protein [Myxococcota bacterium]
MKSMRFHALRHRVAFARSLLAHRKLRTAVATSGVAFAILVVFVQLGFYGAVVNTALAISSRLDSDVLLLSSRFVHLSQADTFPRARLFQALAVEGVESASPLYLRFIRWRDPATGEHCKLFAMGFPLADPIPLESDVQSDRRRALQSSNTILLDRLTQAKCGPSTPDGQTEINGKNARVVGGFDLGVGFLADGSALMSDDTFIRFLPFLSLDRVQIGMIRLREGADVQQTVAQLRELLPKDVQVVTRSQLSDLLERYWVGNTAVGNIFGMGALSGICVGFVVLLQILSADIRNQLPSYATLNAMGYGKYQLYRLVVQESWWFALMGFLPAVSICAIVFPLVRSATRLPLFLTPGLITLVLALSIGMCLLAGISSAKRLGKVDPAELF